MGLPESQKSLKGGWMSLSALFLPGILFGAGLYWLAVTDPRFGWLRGLSTWPWELWAIAACGIVATVGGMLDWGYHRWVAKCKIGRRERNCELLALLMGGGPLFACMTAASLAADPRPWLLPALVALLVTVTLICYDEFVFHLRRCGRLETVCHRLLVFGNGAAWFAWAHWCFVRGGLHA
jgi:hypothetical protein